MSTELKLGCILGLVLSFRYLDISKLNYWFTMVLGVVSVVGVGVVAAAFLYRKRLERSFGRHDESKEENVEGKFVVITGANTGLGKEAAFEMARRGAVVVLACRDHGRAEAAILDIRKRTPRGELIFMELDLSSLESVRRFCKNFNEKFQKIDILINNAGVFVPLKKRMKSNDGYEINFGVNHLGHFLLTNLLLDKLRAAAPSR
ncbi:unnamed protein product [Allacma fusca]|uniref:Uncharacterized protein n=2 Tax=Allacma fusca TaxID=39272 RepID=A0A8J2JCY9_9HEXA|nr:unnamed protein product [Allacma fusca]